MDSKMKPLSEFAIAFLDSYQASEMKAIIWSSIEVNVEKFGH
jgi:hypothetical protein